MSFSTIHPDIFLGVESQHGVTGAGEEQVLLIHIRGKIGTLEIDLDGVRSVAIVDEHVGVCIRREVILLFERPLVVPPAGDDAHLEPVVVREGDVERLGLHLLPGIGRDDGDFLAGLEAFTCEAVGAVPVGPTVSVRIWILPDDGLLGLPVTTLGSRLVCQLRQEDLLAVVGEQLTREGAFEDFLRDGDDDAARALAVECCVGEDNRVAVRVEQFDAVDELQVRTVDGELLAARDFLAGLLGEAGHVGRTEGQGQGGLDFVVACADDDLATVFGDARRRVDADHVVADDLEVGDAHTVGEDDLLGVRETGTIDGHRLVGHDLRREEHLDAQSDIRRFDNRIQDVACRDDPRQGEGQN